MPWVARMQKSGPRKSLRPATRSRAAWIPGNTGLPLSRRFALLGVLLAALLGVDGYAAAAPGAEPAAERIVLPDNVVPEHYDIDVIPDAAAAKFAGSVRIEIEVRQATYDIELNSADLTFSEVRLSGAAGAPGIQFDTARQTATLHFAAPVRPGRHLLQIRYAGRINPDPSGLFYVDYANSAGTARALYTQFENSDARRFFPCWDEPNRKATFTLNVTAPQATMVVSNMPAANVAHEAGGLARTRFQTTPRMSTYLLFLGAGDFQRITRQVGATEVGVVFKRGDPSAARAALDRVAEILPFYEDYFGIRFPLPKLDLVVGPGQSQTFEAMENWGAIFGFERDLFADPATASQTDLIDTYIDIAHEMAHQWFGDLVTMDWWNDLWLNEGFAEWMQFKATDHFHPQWQPWLLAATEREQAMDQDSRAGTHPIITPVANVLQANDDFDSITYMKGMAVIRMLEHQVGEQAFRDAIRRYLRAHEYGNAVTEDLWRELDRATATPVSGIAHDFTLQAGVPLIRVTATPGLDLTQGRFATDASGNTPTQWRVPVVVQAPDGGQWHGIVAAGAAVNPPVSPDSGTLVNAGGYGYFRTLYAPELVTRLSARFASLQSIDQFGLLEDTEALGMAGSEPLADTLQLARRVRADMHPQVQLTVADMLFDIARRYRGRSGEAAFRAYAQTVLEPLYAPVGLKPLAGEDPNINLVRGALINVLSYLGDEDLVRQARELFAQYRGDADSLQGDLRNEVLRIVAEHADAATWDQIHDLARTTHNAAEKTRYYELLGMAFDPDLARQALNLTLSDEIEITSRPMLLNDVADRHPDMAFDFAIAHREQVNIWLEPNARDNFEAKLLTGTVDPVQLEKLKNYVDAHLPASARRPALAVESQIAYDIRIREERLPQIDAWMKSAN